MATLTTSANFISDKTIVLCGTRHVADPNREALEGNRERLEATRFEGEVADAVTGFRQGPTAAGQLR